MSKTTWGLRMPSPSTAAKGSRSTRRCSSSTGSTSVEHLYVGMTRGRHHNLACVITEPVGDEHTPPRQPPTAQEIFAATLRRSGAEKSATETLRDELEQLQRRGTDRARAAIIEGLRQAQRHSYDQTVRRSAQRQAIMFPDHSPAPTVTRDGPEL